MVGLSCGGLSLACNTLLGNESGVLQAQSGRGGGTSHVAGGAAGSDDLGGQGGAAGMSGAGGDQGGVGGAEDPPCTECRKVRLVETTQADIIGSLGGGLSANVCPENEVVVGVEAWVNPDYLAGLSVVCGSLNVSAKKADTLEIARASALLLRGNAYGSAVLGSCSAGQVLTGVHATAVTQPVPDGETVLLVSLQLSCAPLVWSGQALSTGSPVTVDLPFTPRGSANVDEARHCPAGTLARGLLIRAGAWIDGLAPICAKPVLAQANGVACASDLECQSGVCKSTCRAAQCANPETCDCRLFDDQTYRFCRSQTHSAAAAACSAAGEQLAELESQPVNGWLSSTARNLSYPAQLWLGADDKEVDNTFRWKSSGEVADLGFWPETGPNGQAPKDCLLLDLDGRWRGEPCDTEHAFVCE